MYERKTQSAIAELVRIGDEEGLKAISQNPIENAWHQLRFGLHNDEGIHGATPLEILHWIQLGMFGYTRENTFSQTGKGILGQKFNECATHVGWLLQRQSDKSFPRTKFSNGVMKGKLMGHEYTGLVLNCAAAFRCKKGRKILLEDVKHLKKQTFFPNKKWVDDWLMLCETQLQMEAWLKKDSFSVEEVKRSGVKFREIMSMNKVIGKREKGMGNKTFNFHGSIHCYLDILHFGPPKVVNTHGDERRHKKDKGDAKRTQKRPKTFEKQSLERIEDGRVIERGNAELVGRKTWNYYRTKREISHDTGLKEPKLSGVKALVRWDYSQEDWTWTLKTDMKQKKKYVFPPFVRECVQDVAGNVEEYVEPLPSHSELHLPGGQVYRASPHYQGKAWCDWGLFKYEDQSTGEESILPAHIRSFVDLRDIGNGNRTQYKPGIYLIVETVRSNGAQQETEIASEIFVPYLKNHRRIPHTQRWERHVHCWHLDRLIGPTAVIPDVGNSNPNAFLLVRSPKQWADDLSAWINEEHTKEFEGSQVR